MFSLRRFRFRSRERNRATDERRLALIRNVVRSEIADAQAESRGLQARMAKARRSGIFLVQQVDGGGPDPTRRGELTSRELQLHAIEQRLAQLEDHLKDLRKLARRLDLLIARLPPV
jgi:hypothetical protein